MNALIERHVVLIAPEIHWNTGNIGRSCVGTGSRLHLIKPLGFSIESREVKRAGLDYWLDVRLSVWDHFETFLTSCQVKKEEIVLFTKTGKYPVWNLPESDRLFLVFGSETGGIPENIRKQFGEEATYHIPIRKSVRSLNLSTSVGIALYESLRLSPSFHQW